MAKKDDFGWRRQVLSVNYKEKTQGEKKKKLGKRKEPEGLTRLK